MKNITSFNVRVYALIVNVRGELLLADEFHYDTPMVKFPGGGLQFGEGILNCLHREIKEELDTTLLEFRFFHLTEDFVQSAFNEHHQVIAIYYIASIDPEYDQKFRNTYTVKNNDDISFRWESLINIKEEQLTFPVDRTALRKLLQEFERISSL